jgi:hypothetical protein
MLKKYANPDLIEKEKDAWELAVKEKYNEIFNFPPGRLDLTPEI